MAATKTEQKSKKSTSGQGGMDALRRAEQTDQQTDQTDRGKVVDILRDASIALAKGDPIDTQKVAGALKAVDRDSAWLDKVAKRQYGVLNADARLAAADRTAVGEKIKRLDQAVVDAKREAAEARAESRQLASCAMGRAQAQGELNRQFQAALEGKPQ